MTQEEEENILKKLAKRELEQIPEGSSDDLISSKEILDTADNWEANDAIQKKEAWASLQKKLNLPEEKKQASKTNQSKYYLQVGIAAMLIIASAVGYMLIASNEIVLKTSNGEVTTFYLPDSSKIILNSASTISYNAKTYAKTRSLKLSGEGYFEVNQGNKFEVESNGITIMVLGTSFNIYSRETTTIVKCITGKVKVIGASSTIDLTKGEMISSQNKNLAEQKISCDLTKAINWVEGKFYYEQTNLNLVIKELEIQFGIEITGIEYGNKYYSGYFDTTSLEKALKQVLTPMGYTYTLSGKTVVVK